MIFQFKIKFSIESQLCTLSPKLRCLSFARPKHPKNILEIWQNIQNIHKIQWSLCTHILRSWIFLDEIMEESEQNAELAST